jgi:hypothetical protein
LPEDPFRNSLPGALGRLFGDVSERAVMLEACLHECGDEGRGAGHGGADKRRCPFTA